VFLKKVALAWNRSGLMGLKSKAEVVLGEVLCPVVCL